jgi:hypothetical protein
MMTEVSSPPEYARTTFFGESMLAGFYKTNLGESNNGKNLENRMR